MLEVQNSRRLPKLVEIRNLRMSASAFAFLRGSAVVMGADLWRTRSTNLLVPSCGDCHVMNFGTYVSPEGVAVRHQRFRRDVARAF